MLYHKKGSSKDPHSGMPGKVSLNAVCLGTNRQPSCLYQSAFLCCVCVEGGSRRWKQEGKHRRREIPSTNDNLDTVVRDVQGGSRKRVKA